MHDKSINSKLNPALFFNKHLLLLISVILLTFTAGANRAYKALADTPLYEKGDQSVKEIGEIHRGDTVLTNETTEAYILENTDKPFSYLPIEYNGKSGWITYTLFYPVKLDQTDTLRYVNSSSLSNRDPAERYLVPQMEWAMNIYSGPTGWVYGIMISTGLLILFTILRIKMKSQLSLILMGLALVSMSVCEIMHILSFHESLLWFVYPTTAGGWGHAILNFFLLAIVTGFQTFGIYLVWTGGLESAPASAPKWIEDIVFLPIIIAIALLIAMLVDKGETPLSTYILIMSSLAIPAVCYLGWMFMQKRFVEGCVYPILYLLAAVGLCFSLMVTGLLIILVIIALVVAGIALAFAWGALSTVFGGREVTVITNDGRTVKGTENLDGTVSGYDGKKYHVD